MRAARAYWMTAVMAATGHLGDSPLFLADYALRFVRVAVLLALWRILFGEAGTVAGLALAQVLTYTLIAEVFGDQIAPSADLDDALWQGSIGLRFLRPLAVVGQFAAEMVGRWLPGLALVAMPLLLLAPLLGVDPRPAGPAAALLFVPSLALGVTVGLALEFSFGAVMVALDQPPWTISQIRAAIATALSGAVVPLPLLPWGLGEVVGWLPFAAVAAAPLQIYTGTGPALPLLGLQLLWALLLWPLAGWLWRSQREKLTIAGG